MNPLQLGRLVQRILNHSQKLKNISMAIEMGGPNEGCSEWDSGFFDDLETKEQDRLFEIIGKKFGFDQTAVLNAWDQYGYSNRWFNHVTANPQEPLTGREPKDVPLY